MSLSRTFILFVALAPLTFGASKEIVELQRDVAMLQDQVRNVQKSLDEKVTTIQTLVQQTLESVNNTNRTMAVMQDRFNDAMKQQQQQVSGPVLTVAPRLVKLFLHRPLILGCLPLDVLGGLEAARDSPTALVEILHHGPEQEGRNLQVEDGVVGVTDGGGEALVRGGVGEVAADVGQPCGEAVKDVPGQRFAGSFDAFAGVLTPATSRCT